MNKTVKKQIDQIVDNIQVYFDKKDNSINVFNPNKLKRELYDLIKGFIKERKIK